MELLFECEIVISNVAFIRLHFWVEYDAFSALMGYGNVKGVFKCYVGVQGKVFSVVIVVYCVFGENVHEEIFLGCHGVPTDLAWENFAFRIVFIVLCRFYV